MQEALQWYYESLAKKDDVTGLRYDLPPIPTLEIDNLKELYKRILADARKFYKLKPEVSDGKVASIAGIGRFLADIQDRIKEQDGQK